jgi:hypothetical protein
MFAYNRDPVSNNLKDTARKYGATSINKLLLIFKMEGKSNHPGLQIAKHTAIFIRWIGHQKIR